MSALWPRALSRLRWGPAVIGFSISVLVLAACGSTPDAGSSNSGAASGVPIDTSKPTIKLGMIVGTVAGAPPQGLFVNVVNAWAASTNASGGVNGYQIEVDAKDTQGNATKAVQYANAFVADKSVAGVIMGDVTTEAVAAPILSAAKLPIIGGQGYTPTVWGGTGTPGLPYVYGVTTTFPNFTAAAAVAAKQAGATKWIAAICGEYASCNATVPILKAASDKAGIENLGTIQALAASPDYTAFCLEAKNKGANVIAMQLSGDVASRIAKTCTQQGYTGLYDIGFGTADPQTLNGLSNVIGATGSFPWFVDAAPVKAYRDMMTAHNVPTNAWHSQNGTAMYTTMEMFKKAISGATLTAPVTRDQVVTAYSHIKNETLGGLLPNPVTYTAGGPPPEIPCVWVYQQLKPDTTTGSFTPNCDA